jgi:SAM-dependent methyltransferase
MAERERNYWWHLGRLKIIETYINKAFPNRRDLKFLNVGSGTGGTIDTLEQFGQVDNVDTSMDAIKFMKQQGYKNIRKVANINLPFKSKTYDIVGAFDVLEHIEDEIGALQEWGRVLKEGGAIVVTVPAYQWLWSGHDISLHHKRRYTTSRLARATKQAGLKADKKSYAIVFSLPLVTGFRFINKALGRKTDSETSYVNVPGFVNAVFTKILYGEASLHKHMTFWAGTSVIAILRKDK